MKTKDALKERIEIQNEEKPTMTECVLIHIQSTCLNSRNAAKRARIRSDLGGKGSKRCKRIRG